MMDFQTILSTFEYKIHTGSEYQWHCYPHARYLDMKSKYAHVSVLYSVVDQTIYEVTVDVITAGWSDWDEESFRPYRWLNPDFKQAFVNESKTRSHDPNIAYDDVRYIDLDVPEDFFEKATALFNGNLNFDKRVVVALELPRDLITDMAMQAHELDITMNEYIDR
jgi:hypothetical protein